MTMSDMFHNDPASPGDTSGGFSNEVEVERLLSRVVDGEASSSDWQSFCSAAAVELSLWRELAEMQHQHAELSGEVMRAVAIADGIDAPVQEEMVFRFHERVRAAVVVGGWAGWAAAAAAVLVAWGVGIPGMSGPGPNGNREVLQAGIPGAGWTDALQTYLDRGRESGQVVGEIPERILIEARQMPGTGASGDVQYEIIYLRQIMERAIVPNVYGIGTDDAGRPTPVRIQFAPVITTEPM